MMSQANLSYETIGRRLQAPFLPRAVQKHIGAAVIQAAVEATGLDQAPLVLGVEPDLEGRPALLTDNGSGYISKVMQQYLRTLELDLLAIFSHVDVVE